MDHILYHVFKIILGIYKKKHGENTINSSIYKNKNRIYIYIYIYINEIEK